MEWIETQIILEAIKIWDLSAMTITTAIRVKQVVIVESGSDTYSPISIQPDQ